MATKVRLTFVDGSDAVVRLSPRALILSERHFGKDMPAIEGTFYAAWAVLAPGVPFDEWLEQIDDFEESKDEDPRTALSATSPLSPSTSE